MSADGSWSALLAAHAVGATAAVVLGAAQARRRGHHGDRWHRRLGAVWVADMYWVALSSFWIRRLEPGHLSPIHVLSAWTVVSLTVAVWAARTGRRRAHRRWVLGTYAGLVGAGIGAVAAPSRLVPQTALHRPVELLAGLLVVGALVAVTLAAVGVAGRRPAAAA